MSAPKGIVHVNHEGPNVAFRVEGWGQMAHSLPLRRFVEQALGHGAVRVRGDLSRCTYMDSTFVGTLLTLQRFVADRGLNAFALVSPSSQCGGLLKQMGLEGFFPVVPAEEDFPQAWVELSCAVDDCQRLQQNVVQAHQELAGIEGPAGESFREVARCLRQAQDREAGR